MLKSLADRPAAVEFQWLLHYLMMTTLCCQPKNKGQGLNDAHLFLTTASLNLLHYCLDDKLVMCAALCKASAWLGTWAAKLPGTMPPWYFHVSRNDMSTPSAVAAYCSTAGVNHMLWSQSSGVGVTRQLTTYRRRHMQSLLQLVRRITAYAAVKMPFLAHQDSPQVESCRQGCSDQSAA